MKEILNDICWEVLGSEMEGFKEFSSGNNKVFALKSGSDACVVKFPQRTGDMVEKEAFLLEKLSNAGFKVPSVLFYGRLNSLKQNLGENMNSGSNKVLITEYLGSKNLMQTDSRRLWEESGIFLAELHQIKYSSQGWITPEGVRGEKEVDYCREKLSELEEEINFPKDKKRKILKVVKESEKSRLTHYDYQPFQIMIRQNEIAGVLDWEFARAAPPIHDLAKTEFLNQVFNGKFELIKSGYTKTREFPEDYEHRKHAFKILTAAELFDAFKKGTKRYNRTKKILEKSIQEL